MSTTTFQQPTSTTVNTPALSLADVRRIAQSLRRTLLLRRYSHGSLKRSAMAMINIYLRQSAKNFAAVNPHTMHSAM